MGGAPILPTHILHRSEGWTFPRRLPPLASKWKGDLPVPLRPIPHMKVRRTPLLSPTPYNKAGKGDPRSPRPPLSKTFCPKHSCSKLSCSHCPACKRSCFPSTGTTFSCPRCFREASEEPSRSLRGASGALPGSLRYLRGASEELPRSVREASEEPRRSVPKTSASKEPPKSVCPASEEPSRSLRRASESFRKASEEPPRSLR